MPETTTLERYKHSTFSGLLDPDQLDLPFERIYSPPLTPERLRYLGITNLGKAACRAIWGVMPRSKKVLYGGAVDPIDPSNIYEGKRRTETDLPTHEELRKLDYEPRHVTSGEARLRVKSTKDPFARINGIGQLVKAEALTKTAAEAELFAGFRKLEPLNEYFEETPVLEDTAVKTSPTPTTPLVERAGRVIKTARSAMPLVTRNIAAKTRAAYSEIVQKVSPTIRWQRNTAPVHIAQPSGDVLVAGPSAQHSRRHYTTSDGTTWSDDGTRYQPFGVGGEPIPDKPHFLDGLTLVKFGQVQQLSETAERRRERGHALAASERLATNASDPSALPPEEEERLAQILYLRSLENLSSDQLRQLQAITKLTIPEKLHLAELRLKASVRIGKEALHAIMPLSDVQISMLERAESHLMDRNYGAGFTKLGFRYEKVVIDGEDFTIALAYTNVRDMDRDIKNDEKEGRPAALWLTTDEKAVRMKLVAKYEEQGKFDDLADLLGHPVRYLQAKHEVLKLLSQVRSMGGAALSNTLETAKKLGLVELVAQEQ